MENTNSFNGNQGAPQGDFWYVDNYILLKDYYDRTISRIAARCVRKGNIAMEEYPFYGYILDVLEEISETGDFVVSHPALHPYLEKKMAGGLGALKKSLAEFKTELQNNASPDMIKQDKDELNKIKAALGTMDKSVDPTVGAGMSMDQVVEKLMQNQGGMATAQTEDEAAPALKPRTDEQRTYSQQQNQQRPMPSNPQQQNQQPRPQMQQTAGQPHPQNQQGQQQAPRPQNPQAAQQQQRPAQPNPAAPASPFNNGNK